MSYQDTFEGWREYAPRAWEAQCGLLRLMVAVGRRGSVGWSLTVAGVLRGMGNSPDIATAKSEVIRCAETELAESGELLAALKRLASAPCAACGGLARKDGQCVGCGAEVTS